jgi:hypothetical protein
MTNRSVDVFLPEQQLVRALSAKPSQTAAGARAWATFALRCCAGTPVGKGLTPESAASSHGLKAPLGAVEQWLAGNKLPEDLQRARQTAEAGAAAASNEALGRTGAPLPPPSGEEAAALACLCTVHAAERAAWLASPANRPAPDGARTPEAAESVALAALAAAQLARQAAAPGFEAEAVRFQAALVDEVWPPSAVASCPGQAPERCAVASLLAGLSAPPAAKSRGKAGAG